MTRRLPLIPTLVVLGSMYAFILLLTGFFLWASLHVTHQAQFISETYRMRAGGPVRALDRWLDGAVILGGAGFGCRFLVPAMLNMGLRADLAWPGTGGPPLPSLGVYQFF